MLRRSSMCKSSELDGAEQAGEMSMDTSVQPKFSYVDFA